MTTRSRWQQVGVSLQKDASRLRKSAQRWPDYDPDKRIVEAMMAVSAEQCDRLARSAYAKGDELAKKIRGES